MTAPAAVVWVIGLVVTWFGALVLGVLVEEQGRSRREVPKMRARLGFAVVVAIVGAILMAAATAHGDGWATVVWPVSSTHPG